MKYEIIIIAFGAIICSFISSRLSIDNSSKSRVFSAKIFNALSNTCVMGVTALMFWKCVNFYTLPRILMLITICTYIKYKKKKHFCTPFWKNLRVTLLSYDILGGVGVAMYIINKSTNNNYNNLHITIIFLIVIPIIILLAIIIHLIFARLLTRRRASSYYY